jgi:hypothetical protein
MKAIKAIKSKNIKRIITNIFYFLNYFVLVNVFINLDWCTGASNVTNFYVDLGLATVLGLLYFWIYEKKAR